MCISVFAHHHHYNIIVAMHPSEMQCTVKASQLSAAEKPMKLEINQHQEVVVLSELAP